MGLTGGILRHYWILAFARMTFIILLIFRVTNTGIIKGECLVKKRRIYSKGSSEVHLNARKFLKQGKNRRISHRSTPCRNAY